MLTQQQILEERKKLGIPEQGFENSVAEPQKQTSSQEQTSQDRILRRQKLVAQQRIIDEANKPKDESLLGKVGSFAKNLGFNIAGSINPAFKVATQTSQGKQAAEKVIGETTKMGAEGLKPFAQPFVTLAGEVTGKEQILGMSTNPTPGELATESFDAAMTATGLKGAKVAQRALGATGEALIERAPTFRPNIQEAEKIISYRSKNPLLQRVEAALTGKDLSKPVTMGDTASRHGLAGFNDQQIGTQAKRIAANVWKNNIDPALTSIKEKLPKKEVFNDAKNIIEGIAEPGKRNGLLEALDAVNEDYKHISGWTYRTAQDIKSILASGVPEKVWRGKTIAGEYNNVRKILADVIRTKIYEKVPTEIKTSYLDYGNLINIADRGAKALTEASSRGGFGSFLSSLIDKAITPTQTYGGKILKTIGGK
jgi:hypothetical protein